MTTKAVTRSLKVAMVSLAKVFQVGDMIRSGSAPTVASNAETFAGSATTAWIAAGGGSLWARLDRVGVTELLMFPQSIRHRNKGYRPATRSAAGRVERIVWIAIIFGKSKNWARSRITNGAHRSKQPVAAKSESSRPGEGTLFLPFATVPDQSSFLAAITMPRIKAQPSAERAFEKTFPAHPAKRTRIALGTLHTASMAKDHALYNLGREHLGYMQHSCTAKGK